MKKTILGVIIVCAFGAIGYAGYEYSNYNKNLPKDASVGVVQTSTTQQTNANEAANKATSSKSQNNADSKNATTTSEKEGSDSTVAKFVPSKVIDYASQDTNTKEKSNVTASTTQNQQKTSETSVTASKDNSEHTTTQTQPSTTKQNTKPTQDVASSKNTNNTAKPATNPQPKPTTSASSPSENAPIISASDISIPQNSSFNWGLIKVSTNQPNTRIFFSGAVNPAKVGTYPVLIHAVNTDGLKSEKTVNVIVKISNTATIPVPVIIGSNIIIGQGGIYTPNMLDVHATVNGQPVPITYTGTVDNNVPGIYTVTATATNSQGVSTSKDFTVQVIHVN